MGAQVSGCDGGKLGTEGGGMMLEGELLLNVTGTSLRGCQGRDREIVCVWELWERGMVERKVPLRGKWCRLVGKLKGWSLTTAEWCVTGVRWPGRCGTVGGASGTRWTVRAVEHSLACGIESRGV